MKLKKIHLAAVAFSVSAGISQAAVVFSGIANNTGFTVDSTTPLSIVNADVNGSGSWGLMDDGSFGATSSADTFQIIGDATANGLLYKFTAGASTIGSISMYSGWNDNGRVEQHFSVYTTTDVSVTGASTWTLLTTVGGGGSNGSTQFAAATDNSLKVTIYDNASATLASNVTGLRFNFGSDWQQNGQVGYKEIDVQVIPEPSAALLGGLGMLCLLRRRRA